jgi:hypothetical protein
VQQSVPHDITIASHGSDDVVAARMVGTAYAQIVTVERFIDNPRVPALSETVHQGR